MGMRAISVSSQSRWNISVRQATPVTSVVAEYMMPGPTRLRTALKSLVNLDISSPVRVNQRLERRPQPGGPGHHVFRDHAGDRRRLPYADVSPGLGTHADRPHPHAAGFDCRQVFWPANPRAL